MYPPSISPRPLPSLPFRPTATPSPPPRSSPPSPPPSSYMPPQNPFSPSPVCCATIIVTTQGEAFTKQSSKAGQKTG